MSGKDKRKLIVVGNGFDLFFNLPTNYSQYIHFLKKCGSKYANCYKFLCAIVRNNKHICPNKMWSRLEDDMAKWLESYLSGNVSFPSNIDLNQILLEKNESLYDWISSIRSCYAKKFKRIKQLFEKNKNDICIYSFNYTEFFEKWQILSNLSQNNLNKIIAKQVHWFEIPGENSAYIWFGANYYGLKLKKSISEKLQQLIEKFKNLSNGHFDFSNWDVALKEKLTVIKFCCKNFPLNLNQTNFFIDNVKSAEALDGGPDMMGQYFLNLSAMDRCPVDFTLDVYFIGFSFGKQDTMHLLENQPNMLTQCRKFNGTVYSSYYSKEFMGALK